MMSLRNQRLSAMCGLLILNLSSAQVVCAQSVDGSPQDPIGQELVRLGSQVAGGEVFDKMIANFGSVARRDLERSFERSRDGVRANINALVSWRDLRDLTARSIYFIRDDETKRQIAMVDKRLAEVKHARATLPEPKLLVSPAGLASSLRRDILDVEESHLLAQAAIYRRANLYGRRLDQLSGRLSGFSARFPPDTPIAETLVAHRSDRRLLEDAANTLYIASELIAETEAQAVFTQFRLMLEERYASIQKSTLNARSYQRVIVKGLDTLVTSYKDSRASGKRTKDQMQYAAALADIVRNYQANIATLVRVNSASNSDRKPSLDEDALALFDTFDLDRIERARELANQAAGEASSQETLGGPPTIVISNLRTFAYLIIDQIRKALDKEIDAKLELLRGMADVERESQKLSILFALLENLSQPSQIKLNHQLELPPNPDEVTCKSLGDESLRITTELQDLLAEIVRMSDPNRKTTAEARRIDLEQHRFRVVQQRASLFCRD
jgi:hypothetical protein